MGPCREALILPKRSSTSEDDEDEEDDAKEERVERHVIVTRKMVMQMEWSLQISMKDEAENVKF